MNDKQYAALAKVLKLPLDKTKEFVEDADEFGLIKAEDGVVKLANPFNNTAIWLDGAGRVTLGRTGL
jgi:hypothetical protein